MDASGFFGSIQGTVATWLNAGLDVFIIPVAVIILAIVAIVKIAQAAIDHHRGQGDDLLARLAPALICVVIIAILLTKNVWWGFLVGTGV